MFVLLYTSFIVVSMKSEPIQNSDQNKTKNFDGGYKDIQGLAWTGFFCLIFASLPYWSNFATVSAIRKLRELSFDIRGYRFDPNITNHLNVKVKLKFSKTYTIIYQQVKALSIFNLDLWFSLDESFLLLRQYRSKIRNICSDYEKSFRSGLSARNGLFESRITI